MPIRFQPQFGRAEVASKWQPMCQSIDQSFGQMAASEGAAELPQRSACFGCGFLRKPLADRSLSGRAPHPVLPSYFFNRSKIARATGS